MRKHLSLAIRNILRQKTGSLINIFGLSMSLAVCLIILLFVKSERSFDTYNKNYSDIYRILRVGESTRFPNLPIVFHEVLKNNLGELSTGAMIFNRGDEPEFFRYENQDHMLKEVVYTNPEFFTLFPVDFILGNPATALDAPNKLAISESTSKKIFGSANPLGKLIRYENRYDFEVSGVFRDLPSNTHLHASVLVSMESMRTLNPFMTSSWQNSSTQFYYLLPPNSDIEGLARKIAAEHQKALPDMHPEPVYQLQPLSEIHLYSADTTWDVADKGDIAEIRVFLLIAGLILIMACFNYINLSTALSGRRAFYTGIQKVMGAGRRSIFVANFTETLLLDVICSVLAFLIVIASFPAFNSIMGSTLSLSNIDWKVILMYAGLMIFILIVTSLYQSWNLAGISPITVLNRNMKSSVVIGKHAFSRFSQSLTVVQLTITMILIVSVILVYKQTTLLIDRKLGFDKSQLIAISNPWDESMNRRYALFREQLAKLPEVKGIGASWNIPGENINNYGPVERVDAGKEGRANFGQLPVDAEFLGLLEAQFVWGRCFDPTMPSDSNAVIINKKGMEALGLDNPLGQKVKNGFIGDNRELEIIGVVENIQYQSLREREIPAIYYYTDMGLGKMIVRLAPGNLQESIARLEKAWKSIESAYPMEYRFVDDVIQANYQKEIRTRNLLSVMALLAIAISMLGIFGLGVFMARKRTKEIGIRKVNGAKVWEIIAMLNKEFLLWVSIAFVVSTPVSWYAMHKWLENFAFKTSLSWWIFVLAGFLALAIALLTVSWQSWRAATRNPVESLRYE